MEYVVDLDAMHYVAKDAEDFSIPRRLSVNENQRTLAAINSDVNSRVDDTRKRKALKIRNDVEESRKLINTVKIKQNGNKADVEWALKEGISDKNRNGNEGEIKWNENFAIDSGGNGIWNVNGRKIKQNENTHWGQCGHDEKPNGSSHEINWNGNFSIGQNDYEGPGGNDHEVKWKRDTLKSQKSSGNEGRIITGQGNDEKTSGNEIKHNGNARDDQNTNNKSSDDGDETKWNGNIGDGQGSDEKLTEGGDGMGRDGNILRDQGDIDEPVGSRSEIKRKRNVIDQSTGKESDENEGKIECNENDPINQKEAEKAVGNRGQRNGNVSNHQNGAEEPNNGFPRKTKTLGLLCRKFLLEVLEYVDCGDDKINLEAIACSMKVEKRRIYDVVNVMEALGAMRKSHKSFYTWEGLDNLPSTLHNLKIEADKEAVYEKVLMTQHVMTRFMEVPNMNGNANGSLDSAGPSQTPDDNDISTAEQSNSPGNSNNGSVSSKQYCSKKKESKRQRGLNSLTYLCKYFFKILIVGLDYEPDYKVSLDVASTILIKDPEIDGCKPPDRSRCRRIYDVANVLISLRLIERRMFTFGTKKIPLFVYCGPKITENGKFDFFHHIRFNKLSVKLKNSEEKKAYEVEEESLETFFLKKNKKKQGTELSNSVDEPAEKRRRIEGTDLIQENVDVEKENVPVAVINQVIPSSQDPTPMSILRPQPQKAADLTSVLASQTFSPFNGLQSVVQQSRLAQFMPIPICSQEFLPFDPNMILLNNGNTLHNITSSRIPMQQNNFNYLPIAYPLSPMAFFQQSYGPSIDNRNIIYSVYNNISNSFIHSANTLRSSIFNIDSILGNREIHQTNQVADEINFATSTSQHFNPARNQNALL
ncbi:unnamed protein product [Cercopithifilaria johnstoni]|uniref:E2F/DP family winged-helix DNA-binding domain-containing protein n=1 Tax=Cercopithifilaria johnstoni TaxID=2874296 RepID=A0A8J2LZP6_9BILA|nr:unnamed protein product [Cercopithifilaria johnstoni]